MLTEAGLLDYKSEDTPIVVNHGLKLTEGAQLVDEERYLRMVGKLIYLAHATLNMAYSVELLGDLCTKPKNNTWIQ